MQQLFFSYIKQIEPLPGFSPAYRKSVEQHDIRFMEKSDYRLGSPLIISVTAKCTIKLKSKGVNVVSQSPAEAKFRNYLALPQTQSTTPCESIKMLVHYLKANGTLCFCTQEVKSFVN